MASSAAAGGLLLAMWGAGASAGFAFALPILVPAGLIALGLAAGAKVAHAATLNRYKWSQAKDKKDPERIALNSLENQEIAEGFLLTAATLVGTGAIPIKAVTALGSTAGLTLVSLGIGIHALHERIRAIQQYHAAGKLVAVGEAEEDAEDGLARQVQQQGQQHTTTGGSRSDQQSHLQQSAQGYEHLQPKRGLTSTVEKQRQRSEALHLAISSFVKLLGAAAIGTGSLLITAPIAPALIAGGFGVVAASHLYNNSAWTTLFGRKEQDLESEKSFRAEMAERRAVTRLA